MSPSSQETNQLSKSQAGDTPTSADVTQQKMNAAAVRAGAHGGHLRHVQRMSGGRTPSHKCAARPNFRAPHQKQVMEFSRKRGRHWKFLEKENWMWRHYKRGVCDRCPLSNWKPGRIAEKYETNMAVTYFLDELDKLDPQGHAISDPKTIQKETGEIDIFLLKNPLQICTSEPLVCCFCRQRTGMLLLKYHRRTWIFKRGWRRFNSVYTKKLRGNLDTRNDVEKYHKNRQRFNNFNNQVCSLCECR